MFIPILAAKYTSYMLLGYGLAAGILALIIVSIWWRYQSLDKDERLLEQLEKDDPKNS